LGSAEIVHPFHPLRGQRFTVLKVRTVSGVETLSLRHEKLGSLAVPQEWTDWSLTGSAVGSINPERLIDVWGLLALTELIAAVTSENFGVDR
jgi:Family of unknown function (DUF5372)